MREIKFRAWHKKRKKYYEVLHLHLSTVFNGGMWATCLGFDVIDQKDIHVNIQPKDVIIEQYTGLKDKNGVEIYEGDIVIGKYHNLNVNYSHKGFVSMGYTHDSDGWAYGTTYGWVSNHSDEDTSSLLDLVNGGYCEIIGNIHEVDDGN